MDSFGVQPEKSPASLSDGRSAPGIVRVGKNAWRSAKADSLSFLIDGSGYFPKLDRALRQARRRIWIIGWDFNPDIRLRPAESSETLGELLMSLADENADLEVRILVWGMGPVYSGKSLRLFGSTPLSEHPGITLKFDLGHPIRGCHHQKIVCIDDEVAFVGGIDLTARRWDDSAHKAFNPLRRAPNGETYGPVHDLQAMVTGSAAALLGDVARRRWSRLTGENHGRQVSSADSGGTAGDAMFRDCNVALALTEPALFGRKGKREAMQLTIDALSAAENHIYIEAQYLASFKVARILSRRLREIGGPEIVILVTRSSHGFIEKVMMGANRDRLIRKLMRADRFDRLRVAYAVVPNAEGGETEIIIHSKIIVIDDHFIRIGSSNLNNRSEGLDTECDLAFEASSAAHRQAISALRNQLMAEHLDAEPETVGAMVKATQSIVAVIDRLNVNARGLRPFGVDVQEGETLPVPGSGFVDPVKPFWPIQTLAMRGTWWRKRLLTISRSLFPAPRNFADKEER